MSSFIKTINNLDKRWSLLLLFVFVAFLIAGTIFSFQFQKQQRTISLEKSISTLKMQAIKAEYDGELDKADSLYTKALDDAYDSKSVLSLAFRKQIRIEFVPLDLEIYASTDQFTE